MKQNLYTISALSLALLVSSPSAFAAPASTSTSTPASSTSSTVTLPNNYSIQTFTNDGTATKPDDITRLGDHIFIGYQNGVGSKGEPNKTGNNQSTIIEYDLAGNKINSWNLTGKCDGLTADPTNNRLLATVNEDGNSSLNVLYPDQPSAQWVKYTYSPEPDAAGATGDITTGGGTDAITIQNGNIYISASAPADSTHAALFQATLDDNTKTVTLKSVFKDNAQVTNSVTNAVYSLGLTDPDSNAVVPAESPKYAGDLMLDAQGDQQMIFMQNPGTSTQSLTMLPLDTAVDDTTWATSTSGTLLVSDGDSNTIYAIKGNFTKGQVFVAIPSDSPSLQGTVGTLDLTTGHITPFATGLKNPHGLLFIPGTSSSSSSSSLKDIQGHWAESSIKELISMEVIGGYPDGTFKPDHSITRAEFVNMLVKALHIPVQQGKGFADTKNHWAKNVIGTAVAHGIVKGYNMNTFRPDNLITREQMAVMIANAFKLTNTTSGKKFTDSSFVDPWAKKAVEEVIANGIIHGYPNNRFKPQSNATRAEAAVILVNALGK